MAGELMSGNALSLCLHTEKHSQTHADTATGPHTHTHQLPSPFIAGPVTQCPFTVITTQSPIIVDFTALGGMQPTLIQCDSLRIGSRSLACPFINLHAFECLIIAPSQQSWPHPSNHILLNIELFKGRHGRNPSCDSETFQVSILKEQFLIMHLFRVHRPFTLVNGLCNFF